MQKPSEDLILLLSDKKNVLHVFRLFINYILQRKFNYISDFALGIPPISLYFSIFPSLIFI